MKAPTELCPLRDGGQLAFSLHGRKTGRVPLIMICGLTATQDVWEELPALLGRDRQVATFDNRFLGASWRPDAPAYTWEQQAEGAAELAAHLGWSRVALLGHSMGGMIAQTLAAQRPGLVAGVVLLSTAEVGRPLQRQPRADVLQVCRCARALIG